QTGSSCKASQESRRILGRRGVDVIPRAPLEAAVAQRGGDDLQVPVEGRRLGLLQGGRVQHEVDGWRLESAVDASKHAAEQIREVLDVLLRDEHVVGDMLAWEDPRLERSEEHTSELQ